MQTTTYAHVWTSNRPTQTWCMYMLENLFVCLATKTQKRLSETQQTTHYTSCCLDGLSSHIHSCDVGLQEGEYWKNCVCVIVLCTIIMVHKGTSSSYKSVDCIGPLYLLVSWVWWDWLLTWSTNHCPSVLWHCWLGHLIRKTVSEMTYNVSSGTLNCTITIPVGLILNCVCVHIAFRMSCEWVRHKAKAMMPLCLTFCEYHLKILLYVGHILEIFLVHSCFVVSPSLFDQGWMQDFGLRGALAGSLWTEVLQQSRRVRPHWGLGKSPQKHT